MSEPTRTLDPRAAAERVRTLVAEWRAQHPRAPGEWEPAVEHRAYGRIPLEALKASAELQSLRAFLTTPASPPSHRA